MKNKKKATYRWTFSIRLHILIARRGVHWSFSFLKIIFKEYKIKARNINLRNFIRKIITLPSSNCINNKYVHIFLVIYHLCDIKRL